MSAENKRFLAFELFCVLILVVVWEFYLPEAGHQAMFKLLKLAMPQMIYPSLLVLAGWLIALVVMNIKWRRERIKSNDQKRAR